jgi:hypothetical protein
MLLSCHHSACEFLNYVDVLVLCMHLEVWNCLLCNAIEYGVLVKIVQCVKCYCGYKFHTAFMALMITFE